MSVSSKKLVSVVIVSWNVMGSLQRCLASLQATKYQSLEVIVVDNASADASVQAAKKFPFVKVIRNDTNLGFPKALNMGLRVAHGDYILILNPDAALTTNFLSKAMEYLDAHVFVGVVGPKLMNPDGSVQGSVFPEPSLWGAIAEYWFGQKGKASKYTPNSKQPVVVNAVSGGCMFMPKKTLDKIGMFTEEVFMYYEDLDYCRRIRQAGLEVVWHPGLQAVHEHGQSAKQNPQTLKYLQHASKWYNGALKYFLMTVIIWLSQKLRII